MNAEMIKIQKRDDNEFVKDNPKSVIFLGKAKSPIEKGITPKNTKPVKRWNTTR